MATRTRVDTSQAAKQKTGTDAGQGRRTTGALSRSSSAGGKSTGSVATQRSPSYLRATQSALRTEPSKPGKKETGGGPTTKPTPTTTRRQSVDRTSQVGQTQRVLSAGPRERSIAVKSPPSKTAAPSRAELGKSKMMPKPMAPSRSGSGSRSGLISGRTVNKCTTPTPSPKPEHTHHFSDAIEAEPRKSDIIAEEEKLTPLSPQPAMEDDHGKPDDEPLARDALFEEEDHIHNQYQEEQEEDVEPEEEEEEHHGSILAVGAPIDEEESPNDNEVIEAEEENHHNTVQISDEDRDLEEAIPYENHDDEHETDHHVIANEGGEGMITESPTEQTPQVMIEVTNEAEEKIKSIPNAVEEPKPVSNEGTEGSSKIEAPMLSKSPPKPQIRAQNSSSGKKESPVYNDVIKEAAGKLLEKRKNRVSALVGAFETVISLQEPDT